MEFDPEKGLFSITWWKSFKTINFTGKSLNKLSIIGINYKDDEKNAKKFLRELGNPYTNIITDPKGINSIEFGAFGVPETYLIENKSKLIIKKFIGPLDDKSFIQLTKIIQWIRWKFC